MALAKQTAAFRFTGGVSTKDDPKAVAPADLLLLENAVFTSPGRIRKRNGFTPLKREIAYLPGFRLGTSVDEGGLGAPQALMNYRDELVAADSTGNFYSYSESSAQWVGKGTCRSVDVTQRSVSVDNYDIVGQDGATHSSGLQAYVWNRDTGSGVNGGLFYALVDGATRQAVVGPRLLAQTGTKGRVIVVGSLFYFYWYDTATTRLYVATLPVGNPQKTLTGTALTSASADANSVSSAEPNFDVAVITSAAVGTQIYLAFNNARASHGTSLWRFSPASPTTPASNGTVAIDGEESRVVTVFADAHLSRVVLAYWNGTAVLFRSYEPALANAADVPQLVAHGIVETIAGVTSITGASTSTDSTDIRFFYTSSVTDTYTSLPMDRVRTNEITGDYSVSAAGYVIGVPFCDISSAADDFLRGVALAGKAFVYERVIFVPLVFDEYSQYGVAATQTTCFLADWDRNIVARFFSGSAAGSPSAIGSGAAQLPGVWSENDTTFRLAFQTLHEGGAGGGTAAFLKGLSAVTFDFFEPQISFRRAELAQAVHVSGGFLAMYDGVRVVEHGFFLNPQTPVCTDSAGAAHSYQYVACYEWLDNNGLVHRSAPSEALTVVTDTEIGTGGLGGFPVHLKISSLRLTYKRGDAIINVRAPPRVVVYRTEKSGTVFRRIVHDTSNINDPTSDWVSITDSTPDAVLETMAEIYTTGNALENLPPPPVGALVAHANRLFALDATNRLVVNFSREVTSGAPVEFSEGSLQFMVPPEGGDVTGLASLDATLVIFKRSSIMYVTGQGPDSTGAGSDYFPQQIQTACGCRNPRSVVKTPVGVMFQSSKGIHLLARDLSVTYIGAAVEAFNGEDVTSAVLLEDANQVRFTLGNGTTLVFDYFVGKWAVFTNVSAVDSVIWNGRHTYLRADGTAFVEAPGVFTDGGSHVPLRVRSAWFQFAGIQGFQRVWRVLVLGEYFSRHRLRVRVGYDFNPEPRQDMILTPTAAGTFGEDSPFGAGSPFGGEFPLYQYEIRPAQQKSTAIQLTIEDVPDGTPGESMSLSALSFELGVRRGLTKTSAARTA